MNSIDIYNPSADPSVSDASMSDPNDIGNLLELFMQGHKQVGNLLGQHIKSKLYPQQSQGMDSQLGPLQDNGLGMPNLPLNSGQFSGQGVNPAFQNIQPATGDYMNVAMGHQQAMADALRRASAMQPPKMGAPVNKHNAGLLAIASLLPLLFAKNKGAGLGGAVQGFMGQANQEQQREFSNNMGAYNTQKQGLLTEADIQNQIANQNLALESGQSAQAMELRKLSQEGAVKKYVANALAASKDDASKLKFVQGMWDRFPIGARGTLYEMVQDIDPDIAKMLTTQPGFIDQLNQSKTTLNKAHAEYFTQAAAYKKVDAATLPALRTALQTRYAAAGKLDNAHAANFAESTILMPAESQAKVTQALASAQNLQSEAADRPVRTANDYARVQATMRGQDAENVRAGLKSLHDHATELKSQADQYVKILTSANASDDERANAAKNLEFVNGQISRLQESYKTLASSLNMPTLPQPQARQAPTRGLGTGKSRSGVTFTYTPQQ